MSVPLRFRGTGDTHCLPSAWGNRRGLPVPLGLGGPGSLSPLIWVVGEGSVPLLFWGSTRAPSSSDLGRPWVVCALLGFRGSPRRHSPQHFSVLLTCAGPGVLPVPLRSGGAGAGTRQQQGTEVAPLPHPSQASSLGLALGLGLNVGFGSGLSVWEGPGI